MHNLTILKSIGGNYATKRFIAGELEPRGYDRAKHFTYRTTLVNDIHSLSEVLTSLESKPYEAIIRGEPIPGIDLTKPLLRRKDKDLEGNEPCFRERKDGVPWIMLDFDKLPLPEWVPEICRISYLIDQLPEYMKDVSYHYQYSSSAGVNGWSLISCHIWMWLTEPRTDTDMQNWAQAIGVVDDAPFRTVQMHYTANPIFQGMVDPLQGKRSGFVQRQYDSVSIPLLPKYYPNYIVNVGFRNYKQMSKGGFDYHLGTIGVRLHMPIQNAICAWIASTSADSDLERLKERLRVQIRKSGRGDIAHYLSEGYLNQSIRSALAKVRPSAKALPFVPETPLDKLRSKLIRKA